MGKTVQGSCGYMGKDVMRLYRKLILSVLITGMAAIFVGCGIHTAPGREENHAARIVNAEFPVTIENYNSEGKKSALFIKNRRHALLHSGRTPLKHCLNWGRGNRSLQRPALMTKDI